MSKLAEKKCPECAGHSEPLKGKALVDLAQELSACWKIIKKHHLEREYKFKDFKEALAFTNKVGALAEKVQHHPDIYLAWGAVKLTLWTHSVDGLTEGDFIFAAKVDKIKK
jgi:4a-hydroxytetrahydrobiopterin dehydratase